MIFAEDTYADIFRYTAEYPGSSTPCATTSMMAAYTASHDTVTGDDIKEAVEELQWVEYAARPHHNFEVLPEFSPQRAAQADAAQTRSRHACSWRRTGAPCRKSH